MTATATPDPAASPAKGASSVEALRAHDPQNIVEVDDLKVHFPIRAGIFKSVKGSVKAVDGVTVDVRRGETLGLVGESGCGKSTLGRVIAGILMPSQGRVLLDGAPVAARGRKLT
ncbi:MAG: ATP-binding cassette domain-containing protein, partial [Chloroflexota bacterium]